MMTSALCEDEPVGTSVAGDETIIETNARRGAIEDARRSGVVVDIEASGFGPASYPIEIGIAMLDGGASWSALVRPEPEWLDGEWDEVAAELHGLTLAELVKSGRPADQVARELWALIGNRAVYSDAPEQDSHWLERLRECAWPPLPRIAIRHLAELLPMQAAHAFRRGEVSIERPHRAEQDAKLLATFVARCWTPQKAR